MGLCIYAWFLVVCTLFLIFVGGMVTSKDAGLAVPDWPLSYGQINPPGWWEIESIRLEHGHRLIGAFVGLVTIGLTLWLCFGQSRRWLKVLGIIALVGVCFQGLMGGLRVTRLSTELAIVHACTAQAYLSLLLVIAAAVTPGWLNMARSVPGTVWRNVFLWSCIFGLGVYLQLILGAIMRHFRAGLVIPDFPLAFGKIIPPLQDSAVAIHFSHRVGAVLVTLLGIVLLAVVLRNARFDRAMVVCSSLIVALIALQIWLGAMVIWQERPAAITTFHVLNGAAILGLAVLMGVRSAAGMRSRLESTADQALPKESVQEVGA